MLIEKSNGGLGVRGVRVVYLSLLIKWRWRLIQSDFPIYKEVLVEKYGSCIGSFLDLGGESWPW